MAEISIIIPVYNNAENIERLISSIKAQTFQDFEVILINDGSTDDSLERIEQEIKGDERFLAVNIENSGQAFARHFAFDSVTAPYTTFIDADDYVKPEFLNHLYYNLVIYEADLSVVNYELNKNGRLVQMHASEPMVVIEQQDIPYEWIAAPHFDGFLWNKLFKTVYLQRIDWDVDYNLLEDVTLITRYLRFVQKVVYDSRADYVYVRGNTTTINSPLLITDWLAVDTVLVEMRQLIERDSDLKCLAVRRFDLTRFLYERATPEDLVTYSTQFWQLRQKIAEDNQLHYLQNLSHFDKLLKWGILSNQHIFRILKLRGKLVGIKHWLNRK